MDGRKKRWTIVVVLAVLIIGGSFYGSWQKSTPSETVIEGGQQDNLRPAGGEPVVYLSGAVNRPGLYKLKPGSRVVDAVEAAGGLAATADSRRVNLAQPVKDGMHIYVPSTAAGGPAAGSPPASAAGASSAAAAASAAGSQTSERISINTADKGELEKLPGIGPALAERIIDYRQTNGPFHETAELKKISGIGEAKYNRIKDRITL
ncbi:MAG: ComEA family DNA-binding protein [Negativicutes bacterium]|nr:ComEA family DNA-binding protein [Negativicutes bacterium]